MNIQAPTSKHQRSSKLQSLIHTGAGGFGAWDLGFLWMLDVGCWSLNEDRGAADTDQMRWPLRRYWSLVTFVVAA